MADTIKCILSTRRKISSLYHLRLKGSINFRETRHGETATTTHSQVWQKKVTIGKDQGAGAADLFRRENPSPSIRESRVLLRLPDSPSQHDLPCY